MNDMIEIRKDILFNEDVTGLDIVVVAAMIYLQNNDIKISYKSIRDLTKKTDAAIHRCLKRLENNGFITVTKSENDGRENNYKMNF